MKTKILITIEGGIFQSVSTNCDADIVVIDYDMKADDPVLVSEIFSPDAVISENDKFYKELFKEESTDKEERFVHNELKNLNF